MGRSSTTQTSAMSLPAFVSALPISSTSPAALRRRLLTWFDRNKRALPWRENRDVFRIWVSEVMLQQTQVVTAVPYFNRFLDAFPNLHTLAQADEQDVLRQWEGLGYYRRARDLYRSARLLVANHDGNLPNDEDVWRKLPGVGRYILGAVLSQAFDRRLPIVEANSRRVLCRLFGQTGDPNRKPVRDWLWQTAEALLPKKRVGDFNQALMELGALVCTATAPRCAECPLVSACSARRHGTQESIPCKSAPPTVTAVREVAAVIRDRGKVLLLRRPSGGRWANMWEFPRLEVGEQETSEAAARRLLNDVLGIKAQVGPELLTIRHSVTRFRITLVALDARFHSGAVRLSYYRDARWLKPVELSDFPVSSPQRLLAREVARPNRRKTLN
jgi:A/G-specific adenine glycosylase